MSSQVPTSNISFYDLRTKWSNKSFGFRTDPGTTNISLGAFRKATLVDSSNNTNSIPDSGQVSLNDFKDKSFNIMVKTDQFRIYSEHSAKNSSGQNKLIGTTGTREDGSTVTNTRAKLSATQSSSFPYSIILFSPHSSSSQELGLYVKRDTSDTDNQKRIIDEATMWLKAKTHVSYNQMQFGLIKKDHNLTWTQQLEYLHDKHGNYSDALRFHGAGFFNYSGSREDITSSDTQDIGGTYGSYLANTFHSIAGLTAGTLLSSDTTSTPGSSNMFYTSNSYNLNGANGGTVYRNSNSLLPYHGFKIKYITTTLDVQLESGSHVIIPPSGTTNWSNSDLNNVFAGMYISGTGITSNKGVYITDIHTNYMIMKQQKDVTISTNFNATSSSSSTTITISGYLYWTLVTDDPVDSTSDIKSIGPPHTVLPLYQAPASDTDNHSETEEWAFFIGDSTSGTTNTFDYDIIEDEPSGAAFSYQSGASESSNSTATSIFYKSGTVPTISDNTSGYFVVIYSQSSVTSFWQGDYQIDDIKISNGSNTNNGYYPKTFNFNSNSSENFKHVKITGGGKTSFSQSEWNGYDTVSNVGGSTGWLTIPYGGHIGSSGNNGGWQRYNETPPSGSTGVSFGTTSNYFLYTEMSYRDGNTLYARILRTPLLTGLDDSENLEIEWSDAVIGNNIGIRTFFWVNSDASVITEITQETGSISSKTTKEYKSTDSDRSSFSLNSSGGGGGAM